MKKIALMNLGKECEFIFKDDPTYVAIDHSDVRTEPELDNVLEVELNKSDVSFHDDNNY